MSPCPKSKYFDTLTDPRWTQVPGGYSVSQETFEQQNGLTDIWNSRYSVGEQETTLTRSVRKQGSFNVYTRPTIGWSMACELDKSKPTRSETFANILNREIKSQEPEVGTEYRDLVVAIMVISGLMLSLILVLTMFSGYRKGVDEDDGFWENYWSYQRSHFVISCMLFVILLLYIPVTYEFVTMMLSTMEDVRFFQDDLPILAGCIDEFNVTEAIALS